MPAKSQPKAARPWTAAEVYEAFRRFRKANPEPKGELEHLNPYTLLVAVVLSAQATDAGVNKATPALFAAGRHAAKDAGARRGAAARLHPDHRALSQQGEERHRAVAEADRRIRRRGAAHPRRRSKRCPASGARPPMSCSTWRSASTTMAVDTHIFRVGNRTGLAPGKTPLEVELGLETGDSGRIHAARASLADPARPLHLSRAQAALRGLPDQRSLPVAGEDGAPERGEASIANRFRKTVKRRLRVVTGAAPARSVPAVGR